MVKLVNKIKLAAIINKSSAKKLTRAKIKQRTLGFSKNEILERKKKVFNKIAKNQPYTLEANRELVNISYEFKLTFNRKANILIKKHLKTTNEFARKLTAIEFNDFALNKDEVVYEKYGQGYFSDFNHIKKFKFKKIKEIILTNKRLIFVFGANRNSYYFSKFTFSKLTKIISISDLDKEKSTILLYCKKNPKLFIDIKKVI